MIKKNNFLAFLLSAAYVVFLSFFLWNEEYLFLVIPLVITVLYFSIFDFKSLFFLVILLTPLSMSLSDLGVGGFNVEMAFPTEPILFGLMLLALFKMLYDFQSFKKVFKHPITICILLYLIWMLITCVTSSMPLVSFKLFLTRLWYILPIFFMGVLIFKSKKNIYKFVLVYCIPLSAVICYTIVRHSNYFFDKHSAHYMMSPFFNDHTSYGAVIAFFIPLLISVLWVKRKHFVMNIFLLAIISVFIIGLILSFTRAAWISLVLASFFILLLKLKINRKFLFFIPSFILFIFFLFQNPILDTLQRNKQDSSDNLIEHFTSISNISTDASNMERINRWKCAINMFLEKPVFGWGPGTYQFQYAPFQLYNDKTIISSNQGDMGNAHSEYLGPLAESGVLGLLFFSLLVLVVILRAIYLYDTLENHHLKTLLLAIIAALLSYFIHGAFNNFLDTDKASVVLWSVISIIVSVDLFHNKKDVINSQK
jgi:putative inorganic carbon (HCO3(-)) transporter